MPYVSFEKIWEDSDGMINLLVSASNGTYSCSQDIYLYPEKLCSFGERLQSFPASLDDKAILEYGSDKEQFYCYFFLQVFVYNQVGHAALEIKVDNHCEGIEYASAHFFLLIEPSFVNSLGRKLFAWAKEMEAPLYFEWETSK